LDLKDKQEKILLQKNELLDLENKYNQILKEEENFND